MGKKDRPVTTACPIKSDKFLMMLARRVRKEAVIIANGNEYGDCNDLNSYCAITSHFFVSVARRYGYNLSLVEGVAFEDDMEDDFVNHCWVQYRGKIIDLTATQFDVESNIHIVNVTNKKYRAIRKNQSVINSLKNKWPSHQTLYGNQIRHKYKAARKKIVEAVQIAA